MDLCIPTFKAANGADFDGHSGEYDKYLARERPVGWREEQRKLDYMSNSVDDGAEKFIKIRMINRDTVVPSQVFNGKRKSSIKVEKLITNATTTICTIFSVSHSTQA